MSNKTENISTINLAQFIAENTKLNLFLTGKAGTGKTWFLKEFKEHTKKKVVVLAPTGMAAINAKAQTIHSFFHFSFSPYIPNTTNVNTNNDAGSNDDEQMLKELDMIIIDEVSMVRADMLDRMDNKLRQVRRSDKPFGGVQLLLIGDLFQLPPVANKADKELLDNHYSGNYYFFNSDAIKKVGFETINLDKVYRQNDEDFVNILDKARFGILSWPCINKLNTRYLPDFEADKDSRYITMVAAKRDADKINDSRLGNIEGDGVSYEASITGRFPEDGFPAPKVLSLKVGSQVMFTKNNYEKGYRNGTVGQVSDFDDTFITVRVEDKEIVVERTSWDNIEYTFNPDLHQIMEEEVGSFTQFPLKPAWAITVHKSQGLTFDYAVIDLPHTFESGQAYVAFSRCRTLEGIVLKRKVNPSTFFVDKTIVDFYKGLETNLGRVAKKVSYVPFEWEAEEDNNVPTLDSQLAEVLKSWRLEKSHSLNIPAYCVLTNKSLNEIATVKPKDPEQLGNINGVGLSTISKFGEEIIKIVKEHSEEFTNSGSTPNVTTSSDNQPKRKSWEITYDMYHSGMSISEIANERGLVEGTIASHLMKFVDNGELDAHEFVSDEIINKVKQYKLDNPECETLKEIYDAFNEEVSYHELRFALKCL